MDTLLIFREVSDDALTRIKKSFSTVHYYPNPTPEQVDDAKLKDVDAIFMNWSGLPDDVVPSFKKTPKLKFLQLPSAGSERAVKAKAFQEQVEKGKQGEFEVKLCNASGIHVTSIPQWCIGQTISLLHQTQKMIVYAHEKKTWGKKDMKGPFGEKGYYSRDVAGKTVGFLGYGTLGRETARLFKPFLVDVIAANSSGKATKDTGYIMPGTGDIDGSIPSEFFATTDDSSFNEFLKRSDILICSLPSTSKTKFLLTKERLALLPKGGLLLNVGRGDLFRSEDLLDALDDNLSGAALDVTDPEPLSDGHPLWTHPNVIITPHISGNAESEGEHAVDLLLQNAKRFVEEKEFFNVVDIEKGY